jgi:phenylpyruvate tautomerase PptA (4-oxalocrotonate tautomerase family)
MADLRDREVAVSEKNDSRTGPSGRRARSADSFYLLVGGSRDVYDVTVNFDSKNGHWCQTVAGARCHGNGNGKGQKYGPPQQRDKRDPQQWCKHVQAALADTEALAEAQDRTAKAFGRVADSYKPKPEPKQVAPTVTANARERLAAIEAEKAAIVAEINGKLADIVGEYGADAVYAVIDEVRNAA